MSKKTRTCLSCGAKAKGEVCRPPIVTEVEVEGENPRRVFYVRRELLFDGEGRVCHSADSLGIQLANALGRRNVDAVNSIVWDTLNFVYNGDVPNDWFKKIRNETPVPLAI